MEKVLQIPDTPYIPLRNDPVSCWKRFAERVSMVICFMLKPVATLDSSENCDCYMSRMRMCLFPHVRLMNHKRCWIQTINSKAGN